MKAGGQTQRWLGWALVVLLAVAVATGAGCLGSSDDDSAETPDTFTLEGAIVDGQTGDGVGGVAISVDDRTTETDADGAFVVRNLSDGEYTLVAEKSGYERLETEVQVMGDRQIQLQLKNESFYDPTKASLANTHWENDVTCEGCHGVPENEVQSPPPDGTCIDCHSLESVQNRTADLDPNPHDDPHGYAEDCGSCHRVHEPSINTCAGCHSSAIIPEVP